ncbi:hypothetical protein R1sor_009576 [Riccia sorocarpa]|uniref:Aminotransferase-like plant mobile domain-containing protein n=1 Tax=Riccia sorocarpa TaxID=122646 RepID=A0ABD3HZ06_9MARC
MGSSTVATEGLGLRQRTLDLMDPSFLAQYSSPCHRAMMSICQFVPYEFKEFKDLDEVEFSALRQFGMLPYVSSLQRHCVPADIFYWGVFNTDVSDERLLITGTDGRTNIIGWAEIMTAFGGDHLEEDEFRGVKIMHRQLAPYKPAEFLSESVEKNLNKELVSGKDYEEVLYYREAAPYGPTYYLMTLIAEVFWSASRSNRFLMPMVYAYLRVLHGHPYNWAKVVLKSLKAEIGYLQKESRAVKDTKKPVQVVWAHVFYHLLYTFRHRIFSGSSLAEPEQWVHWKLMTKEGDLSLTDLADKFPDPITDLTSLRDLCKLQDPNSLPEADTLAPTVGDAKKQTPIKKKARSTAIIIDSGDERKPVAKRRKPNTPGPRVRFTDRPTMSTAGRGTPTAIRNLNDMAAVVCDDIKLTLEKRYASLASQLGPQSSEWKNKFEALQKSKAEGDAHSAAVIKAHEEKELTLNSELASARAEAETLRTKVGNLQHTVNVLNETCNKAKKSLADQTTSLQNATRSRKEADDLQKEFAKLKDSRATWESEKAKLTADLTSAKTELQRALTASERYKRSMDTEMDTSAKVQLEKERLQDEISTLKFNLERAEKTQTSARQELAQARVQLRRFQVQAEPSSAPDPAT